MCCVTHVMNSEIEWVNDMVVERKQESAVEVDAYFSVLVHVTESESRRFDSHSFVILFTHAQASRSKQRTTSTCSRPVLLSNLLKTTTTFVRALRQRRLVRVLKCLANKSQNDNESCYIRSCRWCRLRILLGETFNEISWTAGGNFIPRIEVCEAPSNQA